MTRVSHSTKSIETKLKRAKRQLMREMKTFSNQQGLLYSSASSVVSSLLVSVQAFALSVAGVEMQNVGMKPIAIAYNG